EKSAGTIVKQMKKLSTKYKNNRIFFLDNIIRAKGIQEFAVLIARQKIKYSLFYELRAHIRPYELLMLWEAGLEMSQIGVESLSTRILKKIGKGTTAIQNLQAMKVCAELGISHGANLIVNFPGVTSEEVNENAENIRK